MYCTHSQTKQWIRNTKNIDDLFGISYKFGFVSSNDSARTHDDRYTKKLATNISHVRFHNSVIVSWSIVVIAIEVSRQNYVVGNHNVNVLELIAWVRTLKSSVEKSGMHICPNGVVERVRKMPFRNFS